MLCKGFGVGEEALALLRTKAKKCEAKTGRRKTAIERGQKVLHARRENEIRMAPARKRESGEPDSL